MNADSYNFDIYIESINPNETFKLSESNKTTFIESLKGMEVKVSDDIINGISRNFIIENNKNRKKSQSI